ALSARASTSTRVAPGRKARSQRRPSASWWGPSTAKGSPWRAARTRSMSASRSMFPGRSGHDARLGPAEPVLDARPAPRAGRQVGERLLRGLAVAGGIGLVALEVEAQRGALGAGAREPEDDARLVLEHDAHALVLSARAVHRVGVGEVVGERHAPSVERAA